MWRRLRNIPIGKYRALLKYTSQIDGSKVDVSHHHTSTKAGWEFLECTSDIILKCDSKIIRDSLLHSLILDSTNDGDDWVAILARCVEENGCLQIVLWDLVYMADAKHQTFVDTLLMLYKRDGVDLRKVVGWASDGCSVMKKAAEKFQEQSKVNLIFCHCLFHRIDLSLSSDMWKSSVLCHSVEDALRGAYSIFNRSSQKRKELQKLVREFGRVRVPGALCEVRWLSKLQCLEIFASPATSAALVEYVNEKCPDKQSAAEKHILDILDNKKPKLLELLKILRPMGALTGKLQQRVLDLPSALSLLEETVDDLKTLVNLSPEISALRNDLVSYLSQRIPVQETTWLGFLRMGSEYPDQVVTRKFGLLQERLSHIDWKCTGDDFLQDYKTVRRAIASLVKNGAILQNLHIDMITADLDLGRAWFIYRAVARCISPTSAEAERTFSCLSRLRSKFRRNLHVHLEACVRVSQAKTLGVGFDDDDFIDEVVALWDTCKTRKLRPTGLTTGPRLKKLKGNPYPAQAVNADNSDGVSSISEEEPDSVSPVRAARQATAEQIRAYFLNSESSGDENMEYET